MIGGSLGSMFAWEICGTRFHLRESGCKKILNREKIKKFETNKAVI